MKFACWKDDEGCALHPLERDPVAEGVCLPGAKRLYVITASSWDDAMQQHYDRQGWGKYHPMEDE